MSDRQLSLEAFGLRINPTEAMRAGTQRVWMHSCCGAVVVISGGGDPSGCSCPNGACGRPDDEWWQQRLPVAGIEVLEAS